VFEGRALGKVFSRNREDRTGDWARVRNEEFMVCTPHRILSGGQHKEIKCTRHSTVRVREDVPTAFGTETERDHLQALGLQERAILKCDFKK